MVLLRMALDNSIRSTLDIIVEEEQEEEKR